MPHARFPEQIASTERGFDPKLKNDAVLKLRNRGQIRGPDCAGQKYIYCEDWHFADSS
jgi:hypothetical protein